MQCVCCVCGRLAQGKHWIHAAPADPSRVSHGYCPECLARALREARALRDRAPRVEAPRVDYAVA